MIRLFVFLALLTPSAVIAQERSQSRLLLSIFGGVTSGNDLWEVNRQTVLNNVSTLDTFRLVRQIGSGIMFGASGTIYPSGNLGFYGEITFLGLGLDDRCTLVGFAAGVANQGENQSVCDDITATDGAASTVGFFVGATYRLAPRGFASPYARIQGGFTSRGNSTTEVVGRFVDPSSGLPIGRQVIADGGGGQVSPSLGAALGVMIPVAAGYQVHLELRDHMLFARTLDGPAPPGSLGNAPTSTSLFHNFALSFGMDIVLERRRGRRY